MNGDYEIQGVPQGDYPKLIAQGNGYREVKEVHVGAGTNDVDFAPRFNWAGPGTGSSVIKATGKDYTSFGCGPERAIDGSQTAGWSTSSGKGQSTDGGDGFFPKHIIVKLGDPVDISSFGVDPSSTCGDQETSGTAGYAIAGRANTTDPWSPLASGTFTGADNGTLAEVAASGSTSNIRYLRFTIQSNQVPDFDTTCADGGGPSGCSFTDLTELEVFGTPPGP